MFALKKVALEGESRVGPMYYLFRDGACMYEKSLHNLTKGKKGFRFRSKSIEDPKGHFDSIIYSTFYGDPIELGLKEILRTVQDQTGMQGWEWKFRDKKSKAMVRLNYFIDTEERLIICNAYEKHTTKQQKRIEIPNFIQIIKKYKLELSKDQIQFL